MGFFSRLARALRSNLNDLIGKAEDPEKMLEQIILDMNGQLIEAKKQVAVAIADEKRLKKKFEQEAKKFAEWEQKAMLAVRSGDDELAKEALIRKSEHTGLAAQYQEQWNKQLHSVEQLKTALKVLNHKIEEAKRKKGVLIARQRRAQAMKNIQETMAGLNESSAFETFDRMTSKIEQTEAEADAAEEIAGQTGDALKYKFDVLEQTVGADEELATLKRKMGLTADDAESTVQGKLRVAEEPEADDADADAEMAELEAALAELKHRV